MQPPPDSFAFVYEATLLRLTAVKRSTWQNWVAASVVGDRPDGRYREVDVVELSVVSALVKLVGRLADVEITWRGARASVLERLMAASVPPTLLVLELRTLNLQAHEDGASVGDCLRPLEPSVVVPLTESIRTLRQDFWRFAPAESGSSIDRRRKAHRQTRTRRR